MSFSLNPFTGKLDKIVNDHLKLKNIGASDHHTKYTNAEAVAAVAAADDFVKTTGDAMTGALDIVHTTYREAALLVTGRAAQLTLREQSLAGDYDFRIMNATTSSGRWIPLFWLKCHPVVAAPYHGGFLVNTDALPQAGGAICSFMVRKDGGAVPDNVPIIDFCNYYSGVAGGQIMAIWSDGRIDFKNNVLKDPKNHVAAALSGIKKVVEIDIGGASYFYEVYPTKA